MFYQSEQRLKVLKKWVKENQQYFIDMKFVLATYQFHFMLSQLDLVKYIDYLHEEIDYQDCVDIIENNLTQLLGDISKKEKNFVVDELIEPMRSKEVEKISTKDIRILKKRLSDISDYDKALIKERDDFALATEQIVSSLPKLNNKSGKELLQEMINIKNELNIKE